MKRVLSHILNVLFTVALLALSVSCTQDEMFIQENASPIEIIGRIPNFDPHYVNTRSVKTEAENRIYNMTLLVFNQSGVLEDIQKTEGSAAIFIVNKKTSDDLDDNLTIDGSETMYLLANVEHLFDNWTRDYEKPKTITDLETITSPNNSIGIMRTGFPMVGSTKLTPDMLNNQKIQIELEMLYAKVELNIKLDATQIYPNNPQFQLTSCYVHNLPNGVSLVSNIDSENGPSDFHTNVKADGIELQPVGIDTELTNGESAKYLFYMPEHIVLPTNEVTYPNNISESEKQRYKPLYVENENGNYTAEGKATYVVINGIYTDHQGHIHQVSYKVYLGANPIDNFEIERNGHYINDITIKGMTKTNDGQEGTISIDHRVNVERNDYMIFMEREALLDCHYEVRPIRVVIDADDNDASKLKGSVTIEIIGGGDWIKLEKSNSNNEDASKYCDNGKRKYFTQDLLLPEQNLTTKCEITSNDNNCVWIYIDEFIETIDVSKKTEAEIIEAANAQKKERRSAKIKITYNSTKGDKEEKEYVFTQQCIYPIVSKNRVENGKPYIYYIEYQEEYLHNFDSYDNFGLTNYEGMEWGLDGVQLSHQHPAYYIGEDFKQHQIVASQNTLNSFRYDFYISEKECINKKEFNVNESSPIKNTDYFPFNGWTFSKNIIDYLNNSTRPGYPNDKIGPLSLDSKPQSAIEYCYNKNKRSNDGTGTITTDADNMKWYMPSIDELEDIISSAYTEFEVFQEKFYWSCQPAYELMYLYPVSNMNQASADKLDNKGSGVFYNDDKARARSTRMIYQGMGSNPEYLPSASGVKKTNKGFFAENGKNKPAEVIEFNEIKKEYDDGNKARTELCRVRAIYRP